MFKKGLFALCLFSSLLMGCSSQEDAQKEIESVEDYTNKNVTKDFEELGEETTESIKKTDEVTRAASSVEKSSQEARTAQELQKAFEDPDSADKK